MKTSSIFGALVCRQISPERIGRVDEVIEHQRHFDCNIGTTLAKFHQVSSAV